MKRNKKKPRRNTRSVSSKTRATHHPRHEALELRLALAAYTWSGGAASGNWADPASWADEDQQPALLTPGNGDSGDFTRSGAYAVNIAGSTAGGYAIGSLNVHAGSQPMFDLRGNTLDIGPVPQGDAPVFIVNAFPGDAAPGAPTATVSDSVGGGRLDADALSVGGGGEAYLNLDGAAVTAEDAFFGALGGIRK